MTEGLMLVSFDLDRGSPTPDSLKRKKFKGGRGNQFIAVNREQNFFKEHQEYCNIFCGLVGPG